MLGSLVGLFIAALVLRGDSEATPDDLVLVAFGFALLATMVISVSLEVLLRPRRTGKRRSLRTRVRTFLTVGGRLFEVSRIARRHGLAGPAARLPRGAVQPGGRPAHPELPGGLRRDVHQVRPDRLDPVGSAPGAAWSRNSPTCSPMSNSCRWRRSGPGSRANSGRRSSEIFASFSDEPLAAASIGQTHVAELRGGQRVVVKVRRPDVEVGVARDSAVLRWASRAAQRRSEAARSLGLVPLADELIRSVEQELSYVDEAANARALGAVANGSASRCRRS